MNMEFNYCCQQFINRINNIGKAGFSFLAVDNDNLKYFVVQGQMEGGTKSSIVQTGINYCPFCGIKLEKLIKKQKELFLKIANKHMQFYLS